MSTALPEYKSTRVRWTTPCHDDVQELIFAMSRKDFFLHNQVAGVSDMAHMFETSERVVRDWANENDVDRVGRSFAFTEDDALRFEAEFYADEEDEDDEEEDDD